MAEPNVVLSAVSSSGRARKTRIFDYVATRFNGMAARFALAATLIGAVTITVLSAYVYVGGLGLFRDREYQALQRFTDVAAVRLEENIDHYVRDVRFLARLNETRALLDESGEGAGDPGDQLAGIFLAKGRTRPEYGQVRLLDADGIELVRIDRSANGLLGRTAQLQDKSGRPYFSAAANVPAGEVYISDIDLNREGGKIQVPATPVIRIAEPVRSVDGELLGIVVINVHARQLIDLAAETIPAGGISLVMNQDGDYLAHPDSTLTFGFDLGERHTIDDDIPELSEFMRGRGRSFVGFGTFNAERHLVSARRVDLARDRGIVIAELTPVSAATRGFAPIRNNALLVIVPLLLTGAVAMTLIANRFTRPLRQLTVAANAVVSGDERFSASETKLRSDEVGELARALDDMSERLRAREAEILLSNRELAQFAYIASHDLQQPLRAVRSYLDLLKRRYRDKLDADAKEFIDFAVEGAMHMKQMIDDLLDYSRISNRPLEFEDVDMRALAEDVARGQVEAVKGYGGEITIGPLPTLEADPVMMERLFANLIDNAVKYRTEAPPDIRISAERRGADWEFSVQDNGIGIEPRFREQIFKIFSRLHGREIYEGSGIGLSSCRRIVDRHGGTIWVDAVPEGGSAFRFTIPAEAREPST